MLKAGPGYMIINMHDSNYGATEVCLHHWEWCICFNLAKWKVATASFYFLICYLFSHFSPAAWFFFQACNVSEIYNPPALSWGRLVLKEGDAWISFDRDDTDGTSQQKSKRVSLHADILKIY